MCTLVSNNTNTNDAALCLTYATLGYSDVNTLQFLQAQRTVRHFWTCESFTLFFPENDLILHYRICLFNAHNIFGSGARLH
jgi:hypothetical protein